MDMCLLKNKELQKELHKYKGRVLLRGVVVKVHSSSCAVFTERASSTSHFSGCGGQASDTHGVMVARHYIGITRIRMSNDFDPSSAIPLKIRVNIQDLMISLGRYLHGHSLANCDDKVNLKRY